MHCSPFQCEDTEAWRVPRLPGRAGWSPLYPSSVPCQVMLKNLDAVGKQAKESPTPTTTRMLSFGVSGAGYLQPPDHTLSPTPTTVHLWRFSGGYPALMDCMNKLKNNKVRAASPHKSVWILEHLHHPRRHMAAWRMLPSRCAHTALPVGVPGVPEGAEPDAAVQEEPTALGVQLLE